ncbi:MULTISPECIES: response regulator [unclassified Aureispira]|uniref:response regulator n=1 Tax=unclassified Aureispira TaxID=2649989 RepID=UPI000696DD34|nr:MULTISPECIES: response regulator [unclassified Aureispira]WMX17429.1 response regulator [Aureispira sp. CCB-E]
MKKILVIEDNLEVRENTCEILELSGYEVFSAENGKLGVQEALDKMPDLIICDVMMPVLDGFGTLKVLHKNPKTTHIPFIFLTAKAEKEDFRKGMNLGADDYITKPFTDIELLEAIEIRLEKNQHIAAPTSTHNVFFNVEEHFQNVLKEFLKDKEHRFYNQKDLIFREGSHPRSVFWIKKGKAQTFKSHEYGKELILSLYGNQDFIGISDAFRNSPYQESAVAIDDTEMVLIPKDEFMEWMRSDNSIAQHFIHLLAIKAGEKDKHLLELAYSSVRKRVADSLLRLFKHYKEDDERLFQISIRREELAHIVGTTKETVTRTLSEFKEEGLIDVKGSNITLRDIEGLEATPA